MSNRISIANSEYRPTKGLASGFVHPILGEVSLQRLTQRQIQVLEKEGLLIKKKKRVSK